MVEDVRIPAMAGGGERVGMVRARMAVRLKAQSRGHLSWAGWTVAPWMAAVVLLMSFVADAGQDPTIGATRFLLTTPAPAVPVDLITAPGFADLAAPRALALPQTDLVVRETRLVVGDVAHEAPPDEVDPQATMKAGVLSPTGTCHTFDSSADGYGRGDGVGAVFLKK